MGVVTCVLISISTAFKSVHKILMLNVQFNIIHHRVATNSLSKKTQTRFNLSPFLLRTMKQLNMLS